MRALFASLPIVLLLPGTAAAEETRCGWLDNVTPGNFSLQDRDGEWVLAEQGGYQAEGFDRIPDLSGKEFVETNGPHGYACACVTGTMDAKEHEVRRIRKVKQKPLRDCRKDRALPQRKP
jgi:Protein of unknown function (DUF4087)